MTEMILTQHTGKLLGPVAKLLGYIMNWIYEFTCLIFPENSVMYGNIGLCIILFTLIIYLLLMPLTIKQQKFSKLNQKMQPEIKAIQKKYDGKKDQDSMMAMQAETKEVYKKYGVSPSGSCVQLLIQMPILFALYRVIYNIPAYVGGLKDIFKPVVEGIVGTEGYQAAMEEFVSKIVLKTTKLNINPDNLEATKNSIIDVLYAMPSSAWDTLKEHFAGLEGSIDTLAAQLGNMNYFLGINISNSPKDIMKAGMAAGQYLLVAGAILVPVLSAATQFLNYLMMPTTDDKNKKTVDDNPMAQSMNSMKYLMPLMSFFMVFSLPVGIGIYWIAGAVIRSLQQWGINKYMDKIDIDELIKKNQAKAKKKNSKKKGIAQQGIYNAARVNTRSISEKANVNNTATKNESSNTTTSNQNYKAGSLAAKANMVRDYNERNTRK